MRTQDFLAHLQKLNIKLSVNEGNLRCNAPKGVLTPEIQQELKARKAEILKFLEALESPTLNQTPIATAPRNGRIPLSFAQQRLWFLDQLEPGSTAYNIPAVYRLLGPLDISALEQSFREIIRRHEVLRTTFPSETGQPYQAISSEVLFSLSVTDFQSLQESERDTEVQRLIYEETRKKSFDLAKDALLCTNLLRLGEQEHILVVTMHHIISDGWSMEILLRELAVLYKTFSLGSSSPLPELTIQYADYAIWQQQSFQSNVLKKQLDYWKRKLRGELPVLQLPLDQVPSASKNQGGSISLPLSATLTSSLEALGQKEGCTLFAITLAAFQLLLARLSAQEDIIVGIPVASRDRIETENLIGLFLNNLAIRTDLSGDPTFLKLLHQVRQNTLEAYSYQGLPFEKLVAELQIDRDIDRHPVFDVMVNYLTQSEIDWDLPELQVQPYKGSEDPESKFAITLYIRKAKNNLNLKLVYRQVWFSSNRIKSVLNQYQHLLEQIVEDPTRTISSYSLVTLCDQQYLPNPSIHLAKPHRTPIPTLIAAWVQKNPNHPAVQQGNHYLSYAELLNGADNIAQLLLSKGTSNGTVVAVTGQRSPGFIASVLGILRSGSVLLMIDPSLPMQRQQQMLTTAQAKFLIKVGEVQTNFAELEEVCSTISIDPDKVQSSSDVAQVQDFLALPELKPDQPAYIFFTSGTTGIPKGVMGTHEGLAHFLDWQSQMFSITPQDRTAQLTGLSFDVVLRDIFLPLSSGATLCIPPVGTDLTATLILPWLEQEQITVIHIVPTLVKIWLTSIPTGISLKHLRWIFFAGEPLTDKLISQWRKAFPSAGNIVNLYGPTETTLAKCYYQVPKELITGIQPIGTPLPETQALIFSKNRQLCGIGEIGEIVIRTPFRTRGYINNLENQQRFIRNPFTKDEDDILYYTGDLGRYQPDGLLEILGRNDHQIKLRGVRIELSEIEAALSKHLGIQEPVVIAREDSPGDKRLVAYIIPKPEQKLNVKDLRHYLSQCLPEYMIPSAFVIVESLPLTPNGKIDRRALPNPDYSDLKTEESFVAPRDELEAQLIKIWETTLGIRPISTKSDFFELGGHSLLALQLFAQIEKIFGKALPLATLFQASTVEDLARAIRQKNWLAPWSSLVPMQPQGSKPPLFYIHAGGGNLLVYRELAYSLGNDQPVYGLQPRGLDGKHNPFQKIEDMADHYLAQMLTLQPTGPYFLAGLSTGGTIAFEIAQRLRERGEEVGLLTMFDTSGPDYPILLPLLPRTVSVLSWAIQDWGWRIGIWSKKFVHQVRQEGVLKTSRIVFKKLGLNQVILDEDTKTQRLRVQNQIKEKTERYSVNTGNWIEKLVNTLLIFVLKKSSRPHYANLFASGLVYQGLDILPESLGKVQNATRGASRSYNPQPYLGNILYFRASERPPGVYRDPKVGWDKSAIGGMTIYEIPGSHVSIVKSPLLSEKLKACLEKAQLDFKVKQNESEIEEVKR